MPPLNSFVCFAFVYLFLSISVLLIFSSFLFLNLFAIDLAVRLTAAGVLRRLIPVMFDERRDFEAASAFAGDAAKALLRTLREVCYSLLCSFWSSYPVFFPFVTVLYSCACAFYPFFKKSFVGFTLQFELTVIVCLVTLLDNKSNAFFHTFCHRLIGDSLQVESVDRRWSILSVLSGLLDADTDRSIGALESSSFLGPLGDCLKELWLSAEGTGGEAMLLRGAVIDLLNSLTLRISSKASRHDLAPETVAAVEAVLGSLIPVSTAIVEVTTGSGKKKVEEIPFPFLLMVVCMLLSSLSSYIQYDFNSSSSCYCCFSRRFTIVQNES